MLNSVVVLPSLNVEDNVRRIHMLKDNLLDIHLVNINQDDNSHADAMARNDIARPYI